jgi:lipopolysaccharide/colanic/teichoic acid biosynthesis glycosyltransferase
MLGVAGAHRMGRLKRILDVAGAAAALVASTPLFVAIALAVRLSGQDVFFRQARVGAGLRPFQILKFTTMPKGSETLGQLSPADDLRPTRLGRWLRRTKLNELPQLVNVLRGEMSLVGPRPLFAEQVARYAPEVRAAIAELRPGMTGLGSLFFSAEDELLASVRDKQGLYDELVLPQKGRLELYYRRHCGLALDLRILLLTLLGLVTGRPALPPEARPLVAGFDARVAAFRERASGPFSSTTL